MTEFTCANHHIFSATEAGKAASGYQYADFICPQCGRRPTEGDYRDDYEGEEEEEDE